MDSSQRLKVATPKGKGKGRPVELKEDDGLSISALCCWLSLFTKDGITIINNTKTQRNVLKIWYNFEMLHRLQCCQVSIRLYSIWFFYWINLTETVSSQLTVKTIAFAVFYRQSADKLDIDGIMPLDQNSPVECLRNLIVYEAMETDSSEWKQVFNSSIKWRLSRPTTRKPSLQLVGKRTRQLKIIAH